MADCNFARSFASRNALTKGSGAPIVTFRLFSSRVVSRHARPAVIHVKLGAELNCLWWLDTVKDAACVSFLQWSLPCLGLRWRGFRRVRRQGNLTRALGRKAFKEELAEHEVFTEAGEGKSRSFACLSADNLIGLVAKVYQATPESILKPGYGTKQANQARKMAMYCCQYYGDYKLKEIAEVFGLSHPGSVSTALNDVRVLIRSGRLSSKIQRIDREVVIKRT